MTHTETWYAIYQCVDGVEFWWCMEAEMWVKKELGPCLMSEMIARDLILDITKAVVVPVTITYTLP